MTPIPSPGKTTRRLINNWTLFILLIYLFVRDYHSPTLRGWMSESTGCRDSLQETPQALSSTPAKLFPGEFFCPESQWRYSNTFQNNLFWLRSGVPVEVFICNCCNERTLSYWLRVSQGLYLLIRFRLLGDSEAGSSPQTFHQCHYTASPWMSHQQHIYASTTKASRPDNCLYGNSRVLVLDILNTNRKGLAVNTAELFSWCNQPLLPLIAQKNALLRIPRGRKGFVDWT